MLLPARKTLVWLFLLGDYLKDRFPEIDKTCTVNSLLKEGLFFINGEKVNADITFADKEFFDMFSFKLLQGDPRQALVTQDEIIISESFARACFPGQDPIGQRIILTDNQTVIVGGVMEDIRNSSLTYCDILISSQLLKVLMPGFIDPNMSHVGSSILFIQEKEQANLQSKTDEIETYLKDIFWPYRTGMYSGAILVPLKDVYFSEIPVHYTHFLRKGNYRFVLTLLSVGFVVLLFAVVNYINLTVAQAGFRTKEMATRRLLGSERLELFLRLIIESVVLTLTSCGVALFLAYLLLPSAGQLLETRLDLQSILTPLNILVAFLFIILVGIIAGLLPAVVISNAKPVNVMKGEFRHQTKMVFSKIFIVFQQMITISLVAASLTMLLQINHLLKAPLGYNTNNILQFASNNMTDEEFTTLRREMSRLPGVKRVGYSRGLPLGLFNNELLSYEGGQIGLYRLDVDPDFMEMFGIKIIQDNQLATKDGFYFSGQALREMGIDKDTPSVMFGDWNVPIAGIIDDLWLQNRNEPLHGILLGIRNEESFRGDDRPWHLTLETEGDQQAVYEQVEACYREIIGTPFKGDFMDTLLKNTMTPQIRTGKIVMLFTFIALVISFMGLFAMSTYFIRQRSREVAVRKVFGSDNSQILKKLVFVFMGYVGIAFVIATPFIWYIMRDWLSGYSYRISLNPLIFVAAGTFCLFISFITVFIQCYQAANENPVERIKAE